MKQGRKVCGQRSCFLLSIQVKFNEPWKCWKNRAKKKAHTDTRTYKINMDKTREKKRDLWRWRRLTCVTFRHRFVRCQVKECQNLSLYAHWRHSSTAPPSTAGTQPIGLCCCADEESLVFEILFAFVVQFARWQRKRFQGSTRGEQADAMIFFPTLPWCYFRL